MKNMAWLLMLVFVSCDESQPQSRQYVPPPPGPHVEEGPELTEKGKVVEVAFKLGSTTTTTSETPGYHKTIAKSEWDDPFGMHSRTVRVPSTTNTNTVKVEDQFAVVFECQHGKFVIESLGKDTIGNKLWAKLKQGDPVVIKYKELYKIYPDGVKELLKYDFIDANKESQ